MRLRLERLPRLVRHRRQVTLVDADVAHLVRDDDVVLRVDGALHIVADDVGAVALRGHRSCIGIGQGDLRLAGGAHLRFERRQAFSFASASRCLA